MRKPQRDFILKKLIPFVLRKQGRGFAMTVWDSREDTDTVAGIDYIADNIIRKVPVCGTVCCLGGSIDVLQPKFRTGNQHYKALGLTPKQACGLLYYWEGGESYAWPKEFVKKYAARKSVLGKAKVAVELLKEVVRTNGRCLNPLPKSQK